MNILQVSLFGQFQVACPHSNSSVKVTYTCQALLAYLLLQRGRSHPRELLAGLFWGEHSQDRARRCLNTALWRLRQVLEPEGVPRGTYLLTMGTGEVSFNYNSDYWLDVAVFEERIGPILGKPVEQVQAADIDELEQALQLYTGELLEGFYDDWALRERERLRRLYLNSLAYLMHYYKYHRAYENSLACAQKILDHDHLREEIHREMMRLYVENGQRALAVRQYERCCQILAAELDIPPMEETQRLYAQIVAAPGSPLPPLVQKMSPCGEALQQLQQAVTTFDEACKKLQQAIQLIQNSTEDPD